MTSEAIAKELSDKLAGQLLTDSMARLYSQHTLLQSSQRGLPSWRKIEAEQRLNDAIRLIEAGLIQKDSDLPGWESTIRRAAEIFEWLSHPDMVELDVPAQMISAACYQIAGFPARAAGIMNTGNKEDNEYNVIEALLKHDFPKVHSLLNTYWASRNSKMPYTQSDFSALEELTEEALFEKLQENLCSVLGVVNASLRWGFDQRLEIAIEKLSLLCRVLVRSQHIYPWLLAELVCLSVKQNIGSSLRLALGSFQQTINQDGKRALEKYLRYQYLNKRITAWPSQRLGIEKLTNRSSFALCTPTGSGKTLIAELAILQCLFRDNSDSSPTTELAGAPLVIYLVPSRALATEVESKLARVLKGLSYETITVTGLYGGADWGPTDAWLTRDEKTVVICTYEKAEALIRFLGPWLLNRLRLVIIDEAHWVCFSGNLSSFYDPDVLSINRSLRLESLSSRLLFSVNRNTCDVIALSAVAQGSENAIASWISEDGEDEAAAQISYRSTRQLIGRLECYTGGRQKIEYDLLDGAPLTLSAESESKVPYVPDPFGNCPPAPEFDKQGPEKTLRPYLFWSAMHLSSPDEHNAKHATLIAVTQNIYGYAKDLLELIENIWREVRLPNFFLPPEGDDLLLYQKVLDSCEDYFGRDSYEYKLLERGVVIHHGQMPGLLARLLIDAVESRIFSLVMATSTLSEGVNLPFETILVPTLLRAGKVLSPSEFKNLAGRAGRPGSGTEGRTLVILGSTSLVENKMRGSIIRANQAYFALIQELQRQSTNATPKGPLAELLNLLMVKWSIIANSSSKEEFLMWLEAVNPLVPTGIVESDKELLGVVENLDAVLLASIAQIEQMQDTEANHSDLESSLKQLWQHSFSAFTSTNENDPAIVYITRGKAIPSVYQNRAFRRQLYRTGLPPRAAKSLLDIYPRLRDHLKTGDNYAGWSRREKLDYIQKAIDILSSSSAFKMPDLKEDKRKPPFRHWHDVLEWWMRTLSSNLCPKKEKLDQWHRYVRTYLINRANWGLGSVIALIADEMLGEQSKPLDIQEWKELQIPWIVFWFKELLTWGTLDPVAAYLLSINLVTTRDGAEKLAANYYSQNASNETSSLLDPIAIREWANKSSTSFPPDGILPRQIDVKLSRDFSRHDGHSLRVLPIERLDTIDWIDPAGYLLAQSPKRNWGNKYYALFDFELRPQKRKVIATLYRQAIELGQVF